MQSDEDTTHHHPRGIDIKAIGGSMFNTLEAHILTALMQSDTCNFTEQSMKQPQYATQKGDIAQPAQVSEWEYP